MGGRGSGGRRVGAGRKRISLLERAIGGNAGKRGTVLQHPSSTAVAPVEMFEPPAYLTTPPGLAGLTAQLARLVRDCAEFPQIAEAQARVDALTALGLEALVLWHELAPEAFEARTLTRATTSAFVMLCRAAAAERARSSYDADHRGLAQRVAIWKTNFGLAPLGKPLYAAEPAATVNPLDRFTKKAGA